MVDIFKHIVPSILQTKRDYYLQPLDEESEAHIEKSYVPFVINKALSFHLDCILVANEMNQRPNIDKKLQYQFLLNITRGYKRPFQQWIKYTKPEDLDLVKEFFNYSNEKAKEALRLLTDDQLKMIKEKLRKGGIEKNDKSKRTSVGKTKRKG